MSDPVVRDLIDVAIAAALAGLAAEIEFEPAGDPSQFPALAVFDGGHVVIEREASLTRYSADLTVEGYFEGEGGLLPKVQRNALHARVVAAMMADETLGGTVELIEDGDLRLATAVLASARRLMFAQDFTIQFTTLRGNPALPA